MMKFSKLYAPSTKEIPKDVNLPSHIFLLRGGFVEQIESGLYNFLPLGQRVLSKIMIVVREEMNKAGALETSLSFVTPAFLWKESGRYNVFGKELLRFKDRKENDYVLGPTHEEAMLSLVKNKITSYKELPLHLYQIGLKFRDELRPRFGLLRCREFIMKDGYSFHKDMQSLDEEFDSMYQTYSRIFQRLGFDFRAVEADSGAIGGSDSKEFMVLARNGEDTILLCENCDYAANIEAANRMKKICTDERPQANYASKFHTPNITTIQALADFFHINEFYTIKAVVKKAVYEDEEKLIAFFIRGCDELELTKAKNACGALELVEAEKSELIQAGLVPGFIGFIGLKGLDFYVDIELENEKQMIMGANEKDYHLVGIDVVNLNKERFKSLICVRENDRCVKCGGVLKQSKGIEVGHIFKLGQKYSSAMNAHFLDENGKTTPFYMGCYGMGISRLVAVAVEASFDERGCIWNKELSPFVLDLILLNPKDDKAFAYANSLYENLQESGIEVLFDERNERFGVKMNDFELMGFTYALIIGKGFEKNEVEFIERKGLVKKFLKADEALEFLKKHIL
ncbi:proline--tRNA ligase [Campylobacter sp. MIT 21-1685]|uniref:proline--tRNA ligase n=1 Tax=unclassified Campylobacter TaxID=2593542 RepID=UPI00224A50A1|nr:MULTISPECIES: proline--tRNA ligase [unclassified Campylobacter]MCX2682910.1 proline--tRNA ligase [Campylobacter sp. MIT 21-1684]MCX2751142.1 proline--tRNA ligase [Campylobacter sp. MIT 21-1682]MCX2807391.1 proline--tRNA ligase [Campylobacter sp. MIT 21-1685]